MRTEKILKGSIIELFPVIFIAILGIFKINIFITHLGSEINGYYQFIIQIISYLFLVEAGFGSAITYKLYKPFAENNDEKIKEIYKGSLQIFKKIGLIISALIIIFTFLFQFIIEINNKNAFTVLLSFVLISSSYIASFFFGSRSIVALFSSDQKKYIPATISNIFKILLEIFTIVVIIIFKSLIAVAIVTVFLKMLEEIVLNIYFKKIYKFDLKNINSDTTALNLTKDLIWHQFGYLMFNNVDSVILMFFLGPIFVSVYSLYNYIIKFIMMLFEKISSTVQHVLGEVFAKENKQKSFLIFNDYLFVCFILGIILSLSFLIGSRTFVSKVWINNPDYMISRLTNILFSFSLFLTIIFSPLPSLISANGLFKESRFHTILSATVNLIFSMMLVKKYGILGVLIGTNIAYLFDIFLRINIISREVFKKDDVIYYIKKYTLYITTFFISALIILYFEKLYLTRITNYFQFFLYMISTFVLISFIFITTSFKTNKRIEYNIIKFKNIFNKRYIKNED